MFLHLARQQLGQVDEPNYLPPNTEPNMPRNIGMAQHTTRIAMRIPTVPPNIFVKFSFMFYLLLLGLRLRIHHSGCVSPTSTCLRRPYAPSDCHSPPFHVARCGKLSNSARLDTCVSKFNDRAPICLMVQMAFPPRSLYWHCLST